MLFIRGKIYNRRQDIHAIFGGQQQGGISTPSKYPLIFIFAGNSGDEFGYKDGWTDDGIFQYTGEGQVGNMQFTKGNKAIRDHIKNGKDLFLFQYEKNGQVKFINQMIYIGYHYRKSKDKNNTDRDAIVFELSTINNFTEQENNINEVNIEVSNKTLSELRELANNSSGGTKTITQKQKEVYKRSTAVKEYALKRANGICEYCNKEAPFLTSKDIPFLEVHHIMRLSDGGPDRTDWVAALCPNCHREAHYGKNKDTIKQKLIKVIREKESHIK